MQQTKFHIRFKKKGEIKRTTVNVDTILSTLLAIKLGAVPGTEEANFLVREWLQATIPEKLGSVTKNTSQWTRKYLIEEIADKTLVIKMYDHELS